MAAPALACGTGRDFNTPGAGGDVGVSGENAGGSAANFSPCTEDGARRCSGAVAQTCTNGFWRNGATCANGCTGEGMCSCASGARQCEGNTPQLCLSSAWVDETACDGVREVCTGAGVCASFKLLDAGIVSLANPVRGEDSSLKQHTLSVGRSSCGANYCLSGEIR